MDSLEGNKQGEFLKEEVVSTARGTYAVDE
jgi:hypothetical protein